MSVAIENWVKLSAEKRQLLKKLLKKEGLDFNAIPIVPHPRDKQSYPLSYSQQRLWLLEQLEPGSPLYNIPFALKLKGNLNVQALEASLNAIIQRHEILRTVFKDNLGKPVQIILPELTIPLPVEDLRHLPPEEHQAQIEWIARQEATTPFSLSEGPLLRYKLLQLADDGYVFFITMHHIISDGWSTGVLVSEIVPLYQAFASGKEPDLPPLPIQYVDFALWQREWMDELGLEDHITYWKSTLEGMPEVLDLPTSRPRPPIQTYNGDVHAFQLPESLSAKIRTFARQMDVTLSMVLTAALEILLYRYSQQEDFGVGIPVANRNRSEIENLIGFFVNTLVIRANLENHPTVEEFLQQVKQTMLDAFAHQDMPFEKLVEVLQPERDMSYSPLFQVMLVHHNAPLKPLQLPGLTIEVLPINTGTAKFDLVFNIFEEPNYLRGIIEYNTDLFDSQFIADMARHLENIFHQMVEAPHKRVDEFALISEAEAPQIIKMGVSESEKLPEPVPVLNLIRQRAQKFGDKPAVQCGDATLNYSELIQQTAAIAKWLHQHRVQPGETVGVMLERSVEMVSALLAIWEVGAIYVPLDPDYPADRLNYMARDAQLKALITTKSLQPVLTAPPGIVLDMEGTDWKLGDNPPFEMGKRISADMPAYIIYTSGSTGEPKGVVVTHGALSQHIQQCIREYEVIPEDRYLQFAAMNFDAALEQTLVPLVAGATVVLRDRDIWTPAEFHQKVQAYALTVINPPTPYWEQLAEEWARHPEKTAGLPIRLVIAGGDAMHGDAVRKWHQTALRNVRLLNAYGPTETVITASVYEVPADYENRINRPIVPIGSPFPNRRFYVLDAHQNPVPPGIPGELYIGGCCLAQAYWHRESLTKERFLTDPFGKPGGRMYRTGDRVRWVKTADGMVLEFLGRVDFQVKVRGFRIELGEIESVLRTFPAVQEAVVAPLKQEGQIQQLVGYVVPEKGKTIDVARLREYLKSKLPEYMVPAFFVTLERLPRTPGGKVNRRLLPKPEVSRAQLETAYVAPRTPLETELAQMAAEALGVEKVGVQDNFFELGGHSMLAIQYIARIQEKYGVELPLRTLFENPTVEGIALAITQKQAEAQDEDLLNELLDELENLSDEEARRLLEGNSGDEPSDS